MNDAFKKNIGILSQNNQLNLNKTLVIVFGLGGVGGFTFESLVRIGIGNFIIVDKDKFEITNLNRQLASNLDTIGLYKVDVYKDRASRINQNVNIVEQNINVDDKSIDTIFENISLFNNIENIYVADCIDDINAKIGIMYKCKELNLNLISCMGTANHKYTDNIKISKLFNTKYCPLAKKIRNIIKNSKILNPNVLYIEENPVDISMNVDKLTHISTVQYVPAICGMKIAEFIINQLIS